MCDKTIPVTVSTGGKKYNKVEKSIRKWKNNNKVEKSIRKWKKYKKVKNRIKKRNVDICRVSQVVRLHIAEQFADIMVLVF